MLNCFKFGMMARERQANEQFELSRCLGAARRRHAYGHVRTREMKYSAPQAKMTIGVQTAAAAGKRACSPSC